MEIELKGYKVQIDEEDYERVTSLKWWVHKDQIKKRGRVYFYHSFYISPKKSYNMSLQRFLLNMKRGDGLLGDHINGDTLDNRKCNLRICTTAENTQNMKRSKTNTSGYKGVSFDKKRKKYRARIMVNLVYHVLGFFDTAEEAYSAYCEGSKKYHGEYGRTE